MAGQIAELARDTLRRDFRSIDPRRRARPARRGGRPRADELPAVAVTANAARPLERLGVTPALERTVVGDRRAGRHRRRPPAASTSASPARTVIWAAGVTASGLAAPPRRADRRRARPRPGRIAVEPDLTLPGHPEVFALGDMVRVRDARRRAAGPPGRRARRHAAGPVRRRRSSARGCAAGRVGRSATATRATSRPSAAPARSRTCTWSASAASPPGSPGSSSISSTCRLPEPSARAHPLGVQLRDTRSRRAHHQLRGATSGSWTRWPVRRPPALDAERPADRLDAVRETKRESSPRAARRRNLATLLTEWLRSSRACSSGSRARARASGTIANPLSKRRGAPVNLSSCFPVLSSRTYVDVATVVYFNASLFTRTGTSR